MESPEGTEQDTVIKTADVQDRRAGSPKTPAAGSLTSAGVTEQPGRKGGTTHTESAGSSGPRPNAAGAPHDSEKIILHTEAELKALQSVGGAQYDTCSVCGVFRAFEGMTDECCLATVGKSCIFRAVTRSGQPGLGK